MINPLGDPRRIAAAKLRELKMEFERDGIPPEKARRSLLEDSRCIGRRLFLRVHAFKPTGVALGCPLPAASVQSLFSALCDRAEGYLREICGTDRPVLSYVPPDAYHITLANRTHFDIQKDMRKVRPLSIMEKEQVKRIISNQRCGAVVVHYRGLLVTRSGRLMVPAYPEDTCIFSLKEALRSGVLGLQKHQPVLAENYPLATLTKLGHILVPLDGKRLRDFAGWLHLEGANINNVVKFTDVYTRLGRIPL